MLSKLERSLALGLLVSAISVGTLAQVEPAFLNARLSPASRQPARIAQTGVAGGKSWKATERLLLDMKCTAASTLSFEFPGLSLAADSLEITRGESPSPADGYVTNSVRLISSGGASVTGEARAYALSRHRLDANLTFIFERTQDVPFTDPGWKPPKIAMLRLTQDKRDRSQFILEPAPGDTSQFRGVRLSCERAAAEGAPTASRP